MDGGDETELDLYWNSSKIQTWASRSQDHDVALRTCETLCSSRETGFWRGSTARRHVSTAPYSRPSCRNRS